MKRRIIALILLLVVLLSACAPKSQPGVPTEQQLKVHVLDVGQGDSIFIELPNGQSMLIDAAEKQYGEQIRQYISNLGYRDITFLVATHPHADHIGGMQHIVENMNVQSVYMPAKASATATYEKLLRAIKDKGLKIQRAKAGKVITSGEDFSVEILSPIKDDYGDNMNLYSVIISLVYRERSFLFLGDAEKENEEEIRGVKADFVKVGHHGSHTSSSSEFVRRTGAKYAVISVGKDNSYNLPKDEIISRWQKAGAVIYRTDETGSVIAACDGKDIQIVGASKAEELSPKPAPQSEWVLNISSKKIHRADCSSVKSIKDENKELSSESIEQLLDKGYTACKNCDPAGA